MIPFIGLMINITGWHVVAFFFIAPLLYAMLGPKPSGSYPIPVDKILVVILGWIFAIGICIGKLFM